MEELLKKWAGSKGVKEAIGGFSSIGEAGKRAVPACRKACMALKLHKLLITMLHVRFLALTSIAGHGKMLAV